ncbi:PilZ domain-containing protein [Roseibium sp.]|uniref:PilZ domain-containing protein n=1 Tax=Roseibium sp. TaxID=1936156 RepID=UPI003A96E35D
MRQAKIAEPIEAGALSVLAMDLDTLKCVETTAENFSDWGCRLSGIGLGVLNRNIAVKLEGADEFQKGKVTGRKHGYITVIFRKDVHPQHEKRAERRYAVTATATVCDLSRTLSLKCVITDASRSGCRIEGEGLEALPEEVLVYVDSFERPVRGNVVWTQGSSSGLRLFWDGAKAFI